MAPNKIKDIRFKSDKLTIFTAETVVTPIHFRQYIVKHWEDITKGLEKNSTILFLGGVHRNGNGKLGCRYDIRIIERQVISLRYAAEHIPNSYLYENTLSAISHICFPFQMTCIDNKVRDVIPIPGRTKL